MAAKALIISLILIPVFAASEGGSMKTLRFKVMGKKWILRVLKSAVYAKENGSDSDGVTLSEKRRIDVSFGPEGVSSETLKHELFHAYISETCTSSADLDPYALEEVAAEVFAQRGDEILRQAERLSEEIHEK